MTRKDDQVELTFLKQADREQLAGFAHNKTIWKMFRGTEETYSDEWVNGMIRGSKLLIKI